MVVHILGSLVSLVKGSLEKTNIDSSVFKLHYRWTTSFCYLACFLVAATEYFGDPIKCLTATDYAKPITTFCWVKSTFTINSTAPDGSSYYRGNNYHGLGQPDSEKHRKTYHAYYQWVPFILFFQGCLFYIPHLVWKARESKLVETLLQGLDINAINDGIGQKKENIIKYLKASRGRNMRYSFGYFICEVLSLINVIVQMFLLDEFFGGAFLEYGTKVLNFGGDEDFDPLATTFPRVTMCSFSKFGSSGTLENREALCVLPQNILNEKVFIFMWFWFVILATLTAIHLVFLLVQGLNPFVRIWMLEQRGKMVATIKVEQGLRSLPLGDFFLLKTLSHNLDALTFKDVLLGSVDCPEDVTANSGSYSHFPTVDDEDPVAYKRHREGLGNTPV